MAEDNLFPWIERRAPLTAALALLAFGGATSSAGATVTSTVTGAGQDKLLTIAATAGAGSEPVTLTCPGTDVKVNGSDPSPATPCVDIHDLSITAAGAANNVNLDDVGQVPGFDNILTATILAGAGDDTVTGGPFNVTVSGGAGSDNLATGGVLLESGDTNMTLTNTSFNGGALLGTDTLSGFFDGASLTGGSSPNTIDTSGFTIGLTDTIDGGAGADSLVGSGTAAIGDGANDTFTGGAGSDTIDAQDDPSDEVHETSGFDMKLFDDRLEFYTPGTNTIVETDTYPGGMGGATLTGDNGPNLIQTQPFTRQFSIAGHATSLQGLGGQDTLKGGGTHQLTGGPGDDTMESAGAPTDPSSVVIEEADTNFTLTSTGGPTSQTGTLMSAATGTDSLNAIVEARLTGGAGDNNIDASAFNWFTTLTGGAGGDTLKGGKQDNRFPEEIGGNDSIVGSSAGTDSIGIDGINLFAPIYGSFTLTDTAMTGPLVAPVADTLSSIEFVGTDGLRNAPNNMDASAFSGAIEYRGGSDDDTIKGGNGSRNSGFLGDIVWADTGADSIDGGGGPDILAGNGPGSEVVDPQSDTIRGGAGFDSLIGDAGLDTFDGGPSAGQDNVLDPAAGNVTVTNTAITASGGLVPGTETMTNIDIVEIRGGDGNDSINASAFDPTNGAFNAFFGTTLDGGDGNDTLRGSHGQDSFDGSLGTDRLVVNASATAVQPEPVNLLFSTNLGTLRLDGDDILAGGSTDTVTGIEEASLTGSAGSNKLDAGIVTFPVTLMGGAGADTLTGGSAADSLNGEGGVDEYNANGGDDTLVTQDNLLESIINCGPGTETLTVDPNDVLNADCGAASTVPGGGGGPTMPGGGGGSGGGSGGGGGGTTPPPPDAVAATKPGCFNIPSVVRDRTIPLPGGGKLKLSTKQVDDPVNPLRVTARVIGAKAKTIAFKVNGKTVTATGSAATVPASALKVGSRRNKVDATVTLANGKKATATQLLVVLRCPLPTVTCKRAGGAVSCTSKTPLGALKVKASLIDKTGRTVASGSAPVKKGKYTAKLRGTVPAGTYQYRHVATTKKKGEKLLMVRVVAIS